MATTNVDEIIQTLTDIQHRLAQAWVEGDRELIDGVLAEDWSVTDLAGRVLTKREVFEEAFSSDERQVVSMTIDDIRVRPFSEWAIVTGQTKAAGEYQGEVMEVKLRFTDVFVMRDGRWQAVSSQATMLA
ncbi:MAG TPA: nuclear transport factor 2 family protein [Pyrinomonadaceae bacterium]|nr:nuclear transport factor 2 family protein [Pyrinomonadaceae bacterium]